MSLYTYIHCCFWFRGTSARSDNAASLLAAAKTCGISKGSTTYYAACGGAYN